MRGFAVLVLLLGLAAHLPDASAALRNACDDAMDLTDDGSSLRKIRFKLGAKQPPAAQKWVAPLIKQAISKQADLDRIMTFPKGSPKKTVCKLRSFTYRKLCVPKSGAQDDFRVKLRLRTSCGEMIVKYRVAVSGTKAWATMWGRSKT